MSTLTVVAWVWVLLPSLGSSTTLSISAWASSVPRASGDTSTLRVYSALSPAFSVASVQVTTPSL